MQDIKFYGLNRKTNANIAGVLGSLQTLPKMCPVKAPYTYTFSCEEALKLESSSFPWPVLTRLVYSEEDFSGLSMVLNFNQFRNVVAEMEKLQTSGTSPLLLVSRPPIRAEGFENFYFYLAVDYVAFHNTRTDELFMANVNAENLFQDSKYNPNYVYRIIRSNSFFLIESIIKRDDPRLDVLKEKTVANSFVDSFDKFRNGYRNAYFHGVRMDRNIVLSNGLGYVGDAYNFGLSVGYNVSAKIRYVFEKAQIEFHGTLTREHLINMKLNNNDKVFDQIKSLVEFHNNIQNASPDTLGEIVSNYLSAGNEHFDWTMILNLFTFLSNCSKQKGRFHGEETNSSLIALPDSIGKIDVNFEFEFGLAQFRVKEINDSYMLLRTQWKNPKVQQFIQIENEPKRLLSHWRDDAPKAMFEIDVSIPLADLKVADVEVFKKTLLESTFNLPSTYSGSARTYAPLIFKDQMLCVAENELPLFSASVFRKAASNYFLMELNYQKPYMDPNPYIESIDDDEFDEDDENESEIEDGDEEDGDEEDGDDGEATIAEKILFGNQEELVETLSFNKEIVDAVEVIHNQKVETIEVPPAVNS